MRNEIERYRGATNGLYMVVNKQPLFWEQLVQSALFRKFHLKTNVRFYQKTSQDNHF